MSISAYIRAETEVDLTDDASLIAEFLRGNGSALHTRYEPLVRGVIQRMGVRSCDSDDVAQQVWLVVFRKVCQLRDVRSFPGWLRSVAQRTTLNFLTRRRYSVSAEGLLPNVEGRSLAPDTSSIIAEETAQVRIALGHLSPLDQHTLEQFYFDGHTLVEMSELDPRQAPTGTIKRRLHVARKRLATELGEDGLKLLIP